VAQGSDRLPVCSQEEQLKSARQATVLNHNLMVKSEIAEALESMHRGKNRVKSILGRRSRWRLEMLRIPNRKAAK
jgi:hypothetical protein